MPDVALKIEQPSPEAAPAQNTWMDDSSENESGIQVAEYDITSAPNDFNVSTLISFIDGGAIVLPPYQRNYTWEKPRASKLIESLILGLPVPQLFLYEENRNKFSILDGQQRLMSLYFFVKKRFPRKEKRMYLREIFAEKGLYPADILADDTLFTNFNLSLPAIGGEPKSRYDGTNYDMLGENLTSFQLRTMRCLIIKQNEPKSDNSSVFEIFDRLNTGGVSLKPQEIRANLYYSNFYQALYEINKHPNWRRLLSQPERDTNLRDVELALRAMAMLIDSDEYRPSMTRFLNVFSSKTKKSFTESQVALAHDIFTGTLEAIGGIDKSSFQLNDRFSIGVFEAVMHAAARDAWVAQDASLLRTISGTQVVAVMEAVRPFFREGTSKKENVQNRLTAAIAAFRSAA